MPRSSISHAARARIHKVRCLLLDVDGVLTDGKVYVGSDGSEWKAFHLRDGSGIKLAQAAGLKVGLVSGRPSEATTRRAKQLAVDWLIQGTHDKAGCVRQIRARERFAAREVCFVGDDILDIPAMNEAGFPVAVADAARDTRAAACYVTRAKGGNGAVREVVELIVRCQGKWKSAIAAYHKLSSSPRQ